MKQLNLFIGAILPKFCTPQWWRRNWWLFPPKMYLIVIILKIKINCAKRKEIMVVGYKWRHIVAVNRYLKTVAVGTAEWLAQCEPKPL